MVPIEDRLDLFREHQECCRLGKRFFFAVQLALELLIRRRSDWVCWGLASRSPARTRAPADTRPSLGTKRCVSMLKFPKRFTRANE